MLTKQNKNLKHYKNLLLLLIINVELKTQLKQSLPIATIYTCVFFYESIHVYIIK
jgi:hypothetical protein